LTIEAITPYRAKQITSEVALDRAAAPIRSFMLKQTRPKDVELFVALAKTGRFRWITASEDCHSQFHHQRTADGLSNGFPAARAFILIDLVVATVLMSME